MTFPDRSSAVMVFPWAAAAPGTESRMTRCRGSNARSLAAWLITETAKLAPALEPMKNVEPAEVPPFAIGFATVMIAVPAEAMSGALMLACSCVLEMNVVVRAEPFHPTVAAGSKFVPFTVIVKAIPPARAELGVNNAMVGALAAGVGGGAGSGVAGGVALETGLTKFPPSRKS